MIGRKEIIWEYFGNITVIKFWCYGGWFKMGLYIGYMYYQKKKALKMNRKLNIKLNMKFKIAFLLKHISPSRKNLPQLIRLQSQWEIS